MTIFTAVFIFFLSCGYSRGFDDELIGLPIELEGEIWPSVVRQQREENWEETLARLCQNIDLTLNNEIVDCDSLEIIPKSLKIDRHEIRKRDAEATELEEGSGSEPAEHEPESVPAEPVPAEAGLEESVPAGLMLEESVPAEPVPAEAGLEESVPAGLMLEESVPTESVPAEAGLEESVPAGLILEESVPTEPVPEEPVLTELVPTETVPVETVPAETIPEETVPAEIAPVETVPAEPELEESVRTEPVLAETVPAEIVTAATVPAETELEESVPKEPVPAETVPVPSETVPVEPGPAEPIPAEPVLPETVSEEPAPVEAAKEEPEPVPGKPLLANRLDPATATTAKPEPVENSEQSAVAGSKESKALENEDKVEGKSGKSYVAKEYLNDKQSDNVVLDGLEGTMEETDAALNKKKFNESLKTAADAPKAGESTKQANTGSNTLLIGLFAGVVVVGAAAFAYNYARRRRRSAGVAAPKVDAAAKEEGGREMRPLMKSAEAVVAEYVDEKGQNGVRV